MTIQWGEPVAPRRRENGHSPVLFGFDDDAVHRTYRTYVRCQCGKRLGGTGSQGGLSSWDKHYKRETAKLQEKAK